jgi:hypothetical protein
MDQTQSPQHIFVILGPSRSGTSSITRALKVLGIDLGNNLTRPSKTVNPTGFWEDNEVVYKINREIFNVLNCLSSGITLLDEKLLLSDALKSIQQDAVALIKKRFQTTNAWGFKDPQTSRLIPFWQTIFANLKLHEHYIVALRNPLSSAQSYQNLSGADIETGLLLWLMHIAPAIQNTMGKNRIIISYEHLMENPYHELLRMQQNMGLSSELKHDNVNQYIQEFLDKNLYRNQFSYENLKSHPVTQLFPLCLQTYDLLLRIARDELGFDDAEFITTWRNIWNQIETQRPFYRYIDSLLQKHSEAENKLRYIQRSRVWKLVYPLRLIQDSMHAYHHARKK